MIFFFQAKGRKLLIVLRKYETDITNKKDSIVFYWVLNGKSSWWVSHKFNFFFSYGGFLVAVKN